MDRPNTSSSKGPRPAFGETAHQSHGGQVDRVKATQAVADLLEAFGLDASAEEFQDTPRRVVDMYAEMWAGMFMDPPRITMFGAGGDGVIVGHSNTVILQYIDFVSTCSHHLLPFVGQIDVGYKPTDQIVGISKLARIVDYYAARPQTQERLCDQIAEALQLALKPQGVAVIARSSHGCITCRGAKKDHTIMVTTSATGIFKQPDQWQAFQNLLQ